MPGSRIPPEDIKFMKVALKLSLKGLGFTEPNPVVGAVVVKERRVIATGYHKNFGKAHAERNALRSVKERGATLYVTLEPCPHYGKTPPCTDLIIKKSIRRVVTPMLDPNPRVNGKGVNKLRESGVKVDVGVLQDLSRKINRHYIKFITQKIPYIALKAGVSLDGKLTDKHGESQWITDEEFRTLAHGLRGEFSAILVGGITVMKDNPHLNLREPGWGKKKFYRVVLDTLNNLNPDLNIFKDQEKFPLILFSSKEAKNKIKKGEYHYFVSEDEKDLLNLNEILHILFQHGISSVIVEGGSQLINSFIRKRIYDEIILFQAGKLIGGKESGELFADGIKVSAPVFIKDREVTELEKGCIIRGYK